MKKKIIFTLVFVVILSAAAISAITLFDFFDNNYVFKINDMKISPSEYKVYLYEQEKFFEEEGGTDIWETDFDGVPAEDVAKQNAINSIVAVKSALTQADKLNITLSEEEQKIVKADADKFYSELGAELVDKFDVTPDDIYKIIEEGQIQKKVFDYTTNGFEISDAEFNSYFNDYYNTNKSDLTEVKIKYIFKAFNKDKSNFQSGFEEMQKIHSLLESGSNFDSLMKKYSESSEKEEVDMKKGKFEDAVETAVYAIDKENSITDVITTETGFYIVKVLKITTPNISELKETVKNDYVQKKKQELYQSQSEKWSLGLSIEKNDEVFSAITINSIK